MQETQTISAIIVTYNSEEVIGNCLRSLLSSPLIGQCYVVDNASSDGTVSFVDRGFPAVELIKCRENIGFGRANNLALEKVATKYALIINPDTIIDGDAITALHTQAEHYHDAAIIAPLLLDGEGRVQESYKKDFISRESSSGRFIVPEGDMCADFLLGAAWLLNMEHMKKVGFFDPNIFLYYEDDDICMRIRKAGLGLILTPLSKAVHFIGKSSKPSARLDFLKYSNMAWSRLYVEEKYFGKNRAQKLASKLALKHMAKAILYLLSFNMAKSTRHYARVAGIVRFLMNI